MSGFKKWERELELFKEGKSEYEWDEAEELIMNEFDDGNITSDEFDELMHTLMDLDCG